MATAQVLNTFFVNTMNEENATKYEQDKSLLRQYEKKSKNRSMPKGSMVRKKVKTLIDQILEEAARSGNAQLLQDVIDEILSHQRTNKKSQIQKLFSKQKFMQPSSSSTCEELPKEIWMEILKLLAGRELCIMGQISKQFNLLASDEKLWKKVFPYMIPSYQPSSGTFKSVCLETLKMRRNMLKLDNMDWEQWNNPKYKNPNSTEYDYLLKFLMIGDAGSGKSSILLRFADQTFTESYITTIGVDFKIKTVGFQDKVIKLQCWDTSGQERFRTISTSYYRGTMGILVVFDLTDRNSFTHVREHWQTEIQRYAREDVKVVIVGNKLDLESKRQVTKEEAIDFAQSINAPYGEVSAKTGLNVEMVFASLLNQALPLALPQQDIPRPSLPPTRTHKVPCCSIV